MMKKITGLLQEKGYIFTIFEKIEPKLLKSRKKILIYTGIDIKKQYISVFIVEQKSRFLIKNAKEILLLHEKLISYKEHNFKKNIIFINSPLCSKAKSFLKENKWIVYDIM